MSDPKPTPEFLPGPFCFFICVIGLFLLCLYGMSQPNNGGDCAFVALAMILSCGVGIVVVVFKLLFGPKEK